MKKLFITAFGLFAAFSATAQKLDNSLLWKISGNGLSKPSYLFGTMHISCDATLDAGVQTALENTKQLYLELDMDDPKISSEILAGMNMKNGVTLNSLASTEDYKVLDEFLTTTLGAPSGSLKTVKPMVISTLLIPKMIDCEPQSFEMELLKYTQMQKEEVYGLETVKEQLTLFDNVPYTEQMTDLIKTAYDNMNYAKAETQQLMLLYKSKDINGILEFMKKDGNPLFANHMDAFINNRNKNWIPRIEKIAKEKPTLFAVGAGHLPGDSGVITLLRKQGYTVEAVK
ncbi:TraB/GumN family protein [Flavobacterium zepuense]|uniref:TraB/GumN family protein n=1 Tax=Flavobacterium zepuense TaxID=2593302 RepID=A0A552UY33_9FLAO|nr:TraB/GumN family protein [Flavobacterium zepuense]TRW23133.1 TraB/GumN family protein [Flavobacterium zepuense]